MIGMIMAAAMTISGMFNYEKTGYCYLPILGETNINQCDINIRKDARLVAVCNLGTDIRWTIGDTYPTKDLGMLLEGLKDGEVNTHLCLNISYDEKIKFINIKDPSFLKIEFYK